MIAVVWSLIDDGPVPPGLFLFDSDGYADAMHRIDEAIGKALDDWLVGGHQAIAIPCMSFDGTEAVATVVAARGLAFYISDNGHFYQVTAERPR